MTTARNRLNKADTLAFDAIEERVLTVAQARMLIDRFQAMIRKRTEAEFDPRMTEVRASLIALFAIGLMRGETAVRAAMTKPWSNGQTEGPITELKLAKRQMYGRAKIDLLQARLIGATQWNCTKFTSTSHVSAYSHRGNFQHRKRRNRQRGRIRQPAGFCACYLSKGSPSEATPLSFRRRLSDDMMPRTIIVTM